MLTVNLFIIEIKESTKYTVYLTYVSEGHYAILNTFVVDLYIKHLVNTLHSPKLCTPVLSEVLTIVNYVYMYNVSINDTNTL